MCSFPGPPVPFVLTSVHRGSLPAPALERPPPCARSPASVLPHLREGSAPLAHVLERQQPSEGLWALSHEEPSVGHQLPLQVAQCPRGGNSCLFQLSNCSSDPLTFISSPQAIFLRIWAAKPGIRMGEGLCVGFEEFSDPEGEAGDI